jgi:hypothetical protein
MTSVRRQHSSVVPMQEARSVRTTIAASRLERALRLFAEIRPGEGRTILVLCANAFVILAACYLLKPAADGLLAGAGVDGLSQTEVVGLNLLQVPLPYLYAFNLVLVAMWLVAAFIVAHEHDRLATLRSGPT